MSQEKFQQALGLFKAGNRKQASELLLEVVKSDPGNADAWYGLASCTDEVEKKKFYLQKVLAINPQNTKVLQMLEKINKESYTNPPSVIEKARFSITNLATSLIIGILILCVAWLFYKVNRLENSLTLTQSELASTQTKLTNIQLDLGSTRSALASTIDTLSYVQAIAENANNYAHSHNNFSDSRLKTNISKINDPLNGILSLNGVTFLWNTTKYPELGLSNEPQIGFIAQELEQIYPELVSLNETGFKTVDYAKLIPVLVEAIKQQQLMILDLQQQVDNLEQNK